MPKRSNTFTVTAAITLASCSFGPRLQSALPNVRNVPVLAGLSPSESLARARTYLASRQYGLAIELFRAAGRDPALELDSLNGLAIAYDGIGRADLAERYFEKALALRTDDPRTRRNLSAFYAASGQPQKRVTLLADAAARPSEPPKQAEATFVAEGPLRSVSFAATDARDAVGADLRQPSPLGGAFRPLLVKAAFTGPIASVQGSSTDDPSVICLADPGPRETLHAGDAVKLFRISIGEVFVTSQPAGTSCTFAVSLAAGLKLQSMSNKEYLGLVAAYLDQLNRLHHFAELTMQTHSAAS